MARFRRLKPQVQDILADPDWEGRLAELEGIPAQQLIGPLFAMLLNPRIEVKWHAISAFGPTLVRLAQEDGLERARVVMRRFMWHMNEESGNIGWGIPEAMAEVMACHARLSHEFHKKLASYVQCAECSVGDTNFMDHPPLREAVYWGLGRLAQERPEHVAGATADLLWALEHEESPTARGYAAWTLGLLREPQARELLAPLVDDEEAVTLYRHRTLESTTLGALARAALETLNH